MTPRASNPARAELDGARLARESREAQGLPPTIEDPATIARVVSVMLGGRPAARSGHAQHAAAGGEAT